MSDKVTFFLPPPQGCLLSTGLTVLGNGVSVLEKHQYTGYCWIVFTLQLLCDINLISGSPGVYLDGQLIEVTCQQALSVPGHLNL